MYSEYSMNWSTIDCWHRQTRHLVLHILRRICWKNRWSKKIFLIATGWRLGDDYIRSLTKATDFQLRPFWRLLAPWWVFCGHPGSIRYHLGHFKVLDNIYIFVEYPGLPFPLCHQPQDIFMAGTWSMDGLPEIVKELYLDSVENRGLCYTCCRCLHCLVRLRLISNQFCRLDTWRPRWSQRPEELARGLCGGSFFRRTSLYKGPEHIPRLELWICGPRPWALSLANHLCGQWHSKSFFLISVVSSIERRTCCVDLQSSKEGESCVFIYFLRIVGYVSLIGIP